MSDRLFRDRGHLSGDEGAVDEKTSSNSRRASRSPRPHSDNNAERLAATRSDSRTRQQGVHPEMVPWPTPPALMEAMTSSVASVQQAAGVTLRSVSRTTTTSSSERPEHASYTAPTGNVGTHTTPSNLSTRENELKMKIQALEDTIAEYERQKYNVMDTFAEYRERVAERERKLEAEYSSKIIALSEDVLAAKKAFEERMKEFACIQLQEKFEREKEAALDKLRQEHQKEIRTLEERCNQAKLLQLEQRYLLEIQRLEEERKSLRNEKERLGDTFESKLRRAQSLYETELSASKNLYSKELEALKDHEEALREELRARQEDFRDRLDDLQQQCQHSKDELQKCKEEVALLEARLRQKELQVQAISKELAAARAECDRAMAELENARAELEENKARYNEQQADLQRKSDMLAMLESAKSKLETVISDLQGELRSLKSKVIFLENERQNLESQSDTQAQLNVSQVQALEAVLDTVTKEKEATKDHYERQLEQERSQAQEREFALRRELNRQIDELESQYNDLKEDFDTRLEVERESILSRARQEYEIKMNELRETNEDMAAEVQLLKKQLETARKNLEREREMHAEHDSSRGGSEPRSVNNVPQTGARAPSHHDNNDPNKQKSQSPPLSTAGGGDNVSKLRQQLESKERALQSSSDQVTELITKAGFMRRQLEEAHKQLQARNATIEQLEAQIKELSTAVEAGDRKNVDDKTPTTEVDDAEALRSQVNELKAQLAENSDEMVKRLQEELRTAKEESEATIDSLRSDLERARKEIEAARVDESTLREQIERQLRSSFNEMAAENHVHDVEAFERQLQMAKDAADTQAAEQQAQIDSLTKTLKARDAEMEQMRERIDVMSNELAEQRRQMLRKQQELKAFSAKTDEYIRKREQQQAAAHERRLTKMRDEFEKKLAYLMNKRDELKTQLRMLRQQGQHTSGTESEGEASVTSGRCTPLSPSVHSDDSAHESSDERKELVGSFDQLAVILAEKDEEIERLKAQVTEAEARTKTVNDSKESTPLHNKHTFSSDAHRRDTTTDTRVCTKAQLVEKWHEYMANLTKRGDADDMPPGAAPPSQSRPAGSSSGAIVSTKTPKRRSGSETAAHRSSRSPSRNSSGSGGTRAAPIDKRPAWKF